MNCYCFFFHVHYYIGFMHQSQSLNCRTPTSCVNVTNCRSRLRRLEAWRLVLVAFLLFLFLDPGSCKPSLTTYTTGPGLKFGQVGRGQHARNRLTGTAAWGVIGSALHLLTRNLTPDPDRFLSQHLDLPSGSGLKGALHKFNKLIYHRAPIDPNGN